MTGVDVQGRVTEPDNFGAVVSRVNVGRNPFGITLSDDNQRLFVTHVGVFEYTHLRIATPTGDPNVDYPLCYPGAGYPDETRNDRTISVSKVDPRNLPDSLRDPDGIRCGYVPDDRLYTVPGLGSPNVPESSSVYVLDVSKPAEPADAPHRQDRTARRSARRRDRRSSSGGCRCRRRRTVIAG